ncbi:arsenic transporter [Alicyclobacillus macrosporangiidus]|uniref:arsenic transporter n=1 Tax=Alicyclobacillus macrosporangiidus TaxID=392015 RepID=UPI0004974B7F
MGLFTELLTVTAFLLTVVFVFWRPRGMNEAIPASCGAALVLLSGSVTLADLGTITTTVGGAAITILATMVMANILESFGFFQWAADLVAAKAKGSGIRLFWLVNLLCFLMTLFFNNDGSILITTPILLILLRKLGLKPHQQIPYLLSGALTATASSAPIGVSNIVNLIALRIVDMSLYMHTAMMFVPATLGLFVMVCLLYLYFRKNLPRKLKTTPVGPCEYPIPGYHPHHPPHPHRYWPEPWQKWEAAPFTAKVAAPSPLMQRLTHPKARNKFMLNIFLFVFGVRVALFVASYVGIPVPLAAVTGSVVLLIWRWIYAKITPVDMIKKTPWYILVFAFSMYVVIYGLYKIGLADWIVLHLHPIVTGSLFHSAFIMGILVSLMSDLFNNHPALMIGTLTLTKMHLTPLALKVSYLSTVIGSDMGSLLFPMGTLATLMWMHICQKGKVKVSWGKYIRTTIVVIPVTVAFTLTVLYFWVSTLF